MRHAAILLMLLGCSAGPSVVTDAPPVPIVVEPAEAQKPVIVEDSFTEIEPLTVEQFKALQDLLKRNPNATQDDFKAALAALEKPIPDADGVTIAELPECTNPGCACLDCQCHRRDGVPCQCKPNWGRGVNRQGSLDSCECGESCDCVDCQCPDCPHKSAAPIAPMVRFVLLTSPGCIHCPGAEKNAATSGVEVEVVSDPSGREARQAGAMRDFGNGLEPAHPAWVVYRDGKPTNVWVGTASPGQIRTMRRVADEPEYVPESRPVESVGGSQPTHDAQPQDAAKAGDSPLSYLRVRGIRGAQQYNASCVAVARDLVLTNSHVVRDEGRLLPTYRVWIGGEWRAAVFVADDVAADLALLRVAGASLSPVALAERPPYGTVETHGYAFGAEYTPRRPVVSLTLTLEDGQQATARHRWFVQTRFEQGESGGAVTQDGRLVGLIHGNDRLSGMIVDLPSIRAFLSRWGVL